MKKISFEEAIKRLDEIVELMDSEDGSLDKSMELYEEGIKLISMCNEMLESAEQKIETLGGQRDDG